MKKLAISIIVMVMIVVVSSFSAYSFESEKMVDPKIKQYREMVFENCNPKFRENQYKKVTHKIIKSLMVENRYWFIDHIGKDRTKGMMFITPSYEMTSQILKDNYEGWYVMELASCTKGSTMLKKMDKKDRNAIRDEFKAQMAKF